MLRVYHIWHGTLESRQYLKRIQDFTPTAKKINKRDKNGLFITDDDSYVREYFEKRENTGHTETLYDEFYSKSKKVTNRKNTDKEAYDKKRAELRREYPNHDDSFIESMLIGYMTDSTLMGTALGGNVLGAMVGDMMNHSDETPNVEFGGGEFGGAGAGGTWEANNNDTENFS
jgi:hypothetical protein